MNKQGKVEKQWSENKECTHMCKSIRVVGWGLWCGAGAARWCTVTVALPPHGSRDPSWILSLGYYLLLMFAPCTVNFPTFAHCSWNLDPPLSGPGWRMKKWWLVLLQVLLVDNYMFNNTLCGISAKWYKIACWEVALWDLIAVGTKDQHHHILEWSDLFGMLSKTGTVLYSVTEPVLWAHWP